MVFFFFISTESEFGLGHNVTGTPANKESQNDRNSDLVYDCDNDYNHNCNTDWDCDLPDGYCNDYDSLHDDCSITIDNDCWIFL